MHQMALIQMTPTRIDLAWICGEIAHLHNDSWYRTKCPYAIYAQSLVPILAPLEGYAHPIDPAWLDSRNK